MKGPGARTYKLTKLTFASALKYGLVGSTPKLGEECSRVGVPPAVVLVMYIPCGPEHHLTSGYLVAGAAASVAVLLLVLHLRIAACLGLAPWNRPSPKELWGRSPNEAAVKVSR